MACDSSGNLYISDTGNNRIRKVDMSTGIISTVAGGAGSLWGGFSGDGGPATSASLRMPRGVACDSIGNFYIADTGNYRIRKVDVTGIISTVAGTGENGTGYSFTGGQAISLKLGYPVAVACDSSGNIYIVENQNHRVIKVDNQGIASLVAGYDWWGFKGDGGPAISAKLNSPKGISFDSRGNLYIADDGNNRVRKVDTGGIISTVAGNGTPGYKGDGGPAISASFQGISGVACDVSGYLYIARQRYCRFRG